jgi:hypothetical protein
LGGTRWKHIQRFVHVAFIATALHIAYVPYFRGGEPDYGALFILLVYVVGYAYVFVRTRYAQQVGAGVTLLFLFGALGVAPAVLAQGTRDATGADAIFELLGQEKPEGWEVWDREMKFAHLGSMGVEPSGTKYRGRVTDLSGYFAWLGTPEPEGWYAMSVDARTEFVTRALEAKQTAYVESAPVSNTPPLHDVATRTSGDSQRPWLLYGSTCATLLFGLFMMRVARLTD